MIEVIDCARSCRCTEIVIGNVYFGLAVYGLVLGVWGLQQDFERDDSKYASSLSIHYRCKNGRK